MKERKKKRYNIEVTVECRTYQDAKAFSTFMFFSGFVPIVDETTVKVIAKGVDDGMLDYLVKAVKEDDRVVGSSFHRTPF